MTLCYGLSIALGNAFLLFLVDCLRLMPHSKFALVVTGRNMHPIHRLDMWTSGVVVVAKDAVTAAKMHDLFK